MGVNQISIKKIHDIYLIKQKMLKADTAKIFIAINYFHKTPQRRCLTRF